MGRLRFTERVLLHILYEEDFMNQRETGTIYEQKALDYLLEQGCRLVQKNYRCPRGEIDLIVRDSDYLVFVEVKYRRGSGRGNPLEAVTLEKQRKISRTAAWYLYQKYRDQEVPCRFDVVGICGGQIRWIQDAFEYIG